MLGTGESQNGCAYKATTDSGKIVVAKTPKRGVREGGSGYKKYTDEKKGLDVVGIYSYGHPGTRLSH